MRRTTAALALAVGVTGLAACGNDDADEARATPAPVALRPGGTVSAVTIGVVVSLTSQPGEGQEWASAAEGAQVAAYRYRQGGIAVKLVAVNDAGTEEGGERAVASLVRQKVSGIVLATSGDHVGAEVAAATDADTPVVLPYSEDTDLPDGAWQTGPSQDQSDRVVSAAVEATGAARPVVVDAGGGALAGLPDARTVKYQAGGDAAALAARLFPTRKVTDGSGQNAKQRAAADAAQERLIARAPDAVVVSGPARLQAAVVAAVQGQGTDAPVYLTPDALSPDFATTLDEAGGSTSSELQTAGTPDADTAAMTSGRDGSSASAYFSALRSLSQSSAKDLFDSQPFGDVAYAADAASHDAVVTLVTAAAKASSTAPGNVAKAMSGLQVDRADGIAGPALNLRSQQAVPSGSVVLLKSTAQDPGLRPAGEKTRLFWFASDQR
ncbi:hypothetical protein GCM10011519_33460 [Marmoricola endophyticus]|uniref:Periplasmic binding protein/LacI sugar binding domain-containing protein n=1 Tax=Marmoricola endophyticus TaxID=2040280 RepID=A0A917BTH8_9ACTN|nr:hypothetical protein [Marmoricola endophyticus]GGF56851.1 hypothetical protein GCM10011519_33460 [Marmoricola endophyticus]